MIAQLQQKLSINIELSAPTVPHWRLAKKCQNLADKTIVRTCGSRKKEAVTSFWRAYVCEDMTFFDCGTAEHTNTDNL